MQHAHPVALQVWWDWPAAYRDRDAATLAAFSKEHARRIDTFVAVQFLFDHFWSAAKVRHFALPVYASNSCMVVAVVAKGCYTATVRACPREDEAYLF